MNVALNHMSFMSRNPENKSEPCIVVVSSLFPSEATPRDGLFIRERMSRVGERLPLVVLSPRPWFPGQWLIRRFRPDYRRRPTGPERQGTIDVYFPRFLAVPGLLRQWDAFFMALSCLGVLRNLMRQRSVHILDAHFAYPDGAAARWLSRWTGLPFCVTLRGTEPGHLRDKTKSRAIERTFASASRVFAVSASLARVALENGAAEEKVRVVGNGVDLGKFHRIDRQVARNALGLAHDALVLVSVGGLVERKGFHRVVEILPTLRRRFPKILYLIVGGPSPEGDIGPRLREQVASLDCGDIVRFCGPVEPTDLHKYLSASNVFVLATRNEGWANVFLEAMACGLPVVTTDVGGNAEVVCSSELGMVVPFGDSNALAAAVSRALETQWQTDGIVAYAKRNQWKDRVETLVTEFQAVMNDARRSA